MTASINNGEDGVPLNVSGDSHASAARLEAKHEALRQHWRELQAEKDVLEKKSRALSALQVLDRSRVLKAEKKKTEKKIADLNAREKTELVGEEAYILGVWFKWQLEEGPYSPDRFPSTGLMIGASFAAFIVEMTGEPLPEHLPVNPEKEAEEEDDEVDEGFSSDD